MRAGGFAPRRRHGGAICPPTCLSATGTDSPRGPGAPSQGFTVPGAALSPSRCRTGPPTVQTGDEAGPPGPPDTCARGVGCNCALDPCQTPRLRTPRGQEPESGWRGWKLPEARLDAHQWPLRRLPVETVQVLPVGAEGTCPLVAARPPGRRPLGTGSWWPQEKVHCRPFPPRSGCRVGQGTPGRAEVPWNHRLPEAINYLGQETAKEICHQGPGDGAGGVW